MKRILLIISLFCFNVATAQTVDYLVVENIEVSGLRKTKPKVVYRELRVQKGDSVIVSEFDTLLKDSKNLLMNTGLFSNVTIDVDYYIFPNTPKRAIIKIALKENWYFYPAPIFEIADRNFNVWWTEQNRSLDRVKYGGEIAHINFTGNNDRLKVNTKFGYTKSLSLGYRRPAINRKQTIGISTDISFARYREVNHLTENNKQQFYRTEDFIYQQFKSGIAITLRPQLRVFHEFRLQYRQEKIDPIIIQELNPYFFPNNKPLQRFFTFYYKLTIDQTDIKPYPLKGYRMVSTLEKNGFGLFDDVDGLVLTSSYARFFPIAPKFYGSVKTKGKLSLLRNRQPYKDNRGLGFGGDNLKGFEFYIIDGLDMVYTKTSLKYQFLKSKINFGKLVPIKAFRRMPFKALIGINNDLGYVNSPYSRHQNPMSNRLLWGGGIGLDLIFYYDKVVQIEYSFNDLLENGLFLQVELNL